MATFLCRRDLLLAITLLSSFIFAQPRSVPDALGIITGIETSLASGAKVEFQVDRTPKSSQTKEDAEKEEVLVLEGVVAPDSEFAQFVVFINLPDADETTPTYIAEYTGSFYAIGPVIHSRNVRFGISDNLKRLGITESPQILVTVVARGFSLSQPPLTVNRVFIEYE